MSFTAGVKNELATLAFESECCKRSFAYGFLLYGKSFTTRSVSCATDYTEVMQAFERTIAETSGVKTTVTRLRSGKYVLKIRKYSTQPVMNSLINAAAQAARL